MAAINVYKMLVTNMLIASYILGTWRISGPTEDKILINSNISDFRWNEGENCQFIKFIKFANFDFFSPPSGNKIWCSVGPGTNTKFTLENASKLSFRFQKMLFWQEGMGMGNFYFYNIFSHFLNIQVNIYQILIARW